MGSDVIFLPNRVSESPLALIERLGEIASILQTISTGELLAAFPDCPIAYENHKLALRLLSSAEMQLFILRDDIANTIKF